jgi:hypothetical protein
MSNRQPLQALSRGSVVTVPGETKKIFSPYQFAALAAAE